MDYEGERDLAIAEIQRFAWRRFSGELLRTGDAPTYAAVREYLRDFEGTRMVGPMFDAARMGSTGFNLDEQLRGWYDDWTAGRHLEPLPSMNGPSRKAQDKPPRHSETVSQLDIGVGASPLSDAEFEGLIEEMLDDSEESEAVPDPLESRLLNLEQRFSRLEERFENFTTQIKLTVTLLVIVFVIGPCFYR